MDNMQAFLAMIAFSELGDLVHRKDKGYSIIAGSRPGHVIKARNLHDHPRVTVQLSSTLWSTAAGAFQILERTYDFYRKKLHLNDFSPPAQRAIAIQLIEERGAVKMVESGDIAGAIKRVSGIWASLPGAGYGQRENKIEALVGYYNSVKNMPHYMM